MQYLLMAMSYQKNIHYINKPNKCKQCRNLLCKWKENTIF
ncbi:hypothetical protein BANRA_03680 [Klebsiella pneumoniae]|nr:hypothetical protein BANRA_03680 [Klebsiella pneumoniae]